MFRKSNAALDHIDSAVKLNLIERLKECVKELQLKYTSEHWTPLKNEEATSMLCWILEAIFIHGLKNTFIKSLSVFATRKDAVPNPSFWDFVMIFSHRDIIEQVRKLNYVNTDIGRCRAWIRFALNEMSLISYLENMYRNPSYVRSFYKPAAFLRDAEKCDILKNYLVGIVESCKFDLVVDNSLLNQWNSGPLSLVGLWVDDNVSQGIDVAQNMESKDLQAIPQLGKCRTPEPQFMNVMRRQPLLPEEDAFRIIMASKPSGSSGTSSRRNSDSSQRSREITASQARGGTNSGLSQSFKEPAPIRTSFVSSKSSAVETQSKSMSARHAQSDKINHEVTNDHLNSVESVDSKRAEETSVKSHHTDNPIHSENPLIHIEESHHAEENDQTSEELSYIELLKTYNQEQMVGTAIFSGSPKHDELFVRESSEETTSTSEVLAIPENEDGIEILTLMRDGQLLSDLFSLIVNYSKRIPAEMGMDTQNYSCKSCRKHIGMVVFPFRYCHFTGFNFCISCHLNEEGIIPSRILLNWDFSRYSVSHQALELLENVREHPIFDVNEVNPKLYLHVEELIEIKKLRTKLNYVSIYLKTCKDPTIYDEFKKLARELCTPDHLYEHVHRYSILDLIAVTDGTLATSLSRLFTFGKHHTVRCNICKAKGFVCEICRNPEVIFPFNLESTFKCHLCGAVYHDKCMSYSKPCPRCERWNVYDNGIEDCDNDEDVTLSISSQVAYTSESVKNEHEVP